MEYRERKLRVARLGIEVHSDNFRESENRTWLPVLLVCLSLLAGFIASMGQPTVIAVFIGAIVGVALLARLDIALWITIVGTFLISGMLTQFAPQLAKAVWLFSMMGFLLLAGAILRLITNYSSRQDLPWYAWLALAFPVYVILVSLANALSPLEFIAGFKRYFQYWGIFACLVLVHFSGGTIRQILRFILAVSLIQVFFALYQHFVVVPTRIGMGGGVVAIDAVAGTFEASTTGGGSSSILVMFVLIVLAYFLNAWREGVIGTAKLLLAASLLLLPLALGETKIVVIFLPVIVVVALQRDIRRHPVIGMLIMLGMIGLTLALAYLYLTMSANGPESIARTLEKIITYNTGSVGYLSASSLNRTTVITFWWGQNGWQNPLNFLFGNGIGASYIGDGALVPGHLGLKYFGLAIGLTGVSTLLWDTGIFGTLWIMVTLVGATIYCQRTLVAMPNGQARSIGIAVAAGLWMNLILLLYSNSMLALPSHQAILMLLLAGPVLLARDAASKAGKAV